MHRAKLRRRDARIDAYMSDKQSGIVYVATKKDRYVAEAFLSATSAKALMPDVPITLFTSLLDSAFAQAPCFDDVIPVQSEAGFDRAWSEGQLDRIRCLPHSPYDYTLHLDSDTRVYSAEINTAFSLLDKHDIAMVECAEDNSYSREHYGQPMFNVGFILYRKSDNVLHLLQNWERQTSEFFDLASGEDEPQVDCLSHIADPDLRRKLLFMDQLSMVQYLSPEVNLCGVDCKILDESWNYRGSKSGRPPPADLKVSHHPDLRKRHFSRDLAIAAMRYQSQGSTELALHVLSWLDGEHPGQMNVMKLLVVTHIELKQFDEALKTLQTMLGFFPGYQWAETAMANVEQLRKESAPEA